MPFRPHAYIFRRIGKSSKKTPFHFDPSLTLIYLSLKKDVSARVARRRNVNTVMTDYDHDANEHRKREPRKNFA